MCEQYYLGYGFWSSTTSKNYYFLSCSNVSIKYEYFLVIYLILIISYIKKLLNLPRLVKN